MNPLEAEFKWYLEHQEELLQRFEGRVLVIKGQAVIGDYATDAEAVMAARKNHEMGTFLVQRCSRGSADYTQHFHSRVSFKV